LGDKRHLWPEFFRLIKACSPDIILGEQVPAAINMGWLDEVFNNLEEAGYATHAIILPSSSVGAPHIRSRLYWSAKLHANQVHWDSSCLKILKTRFVPNIGMSPEYVHTWKTKKTPGGRVVHYLSAGRSTNKAGWPTPMAIEQRETSEAKVARGAHAGLNLSVAAKMAGWGTPRVSDGTLAETTRLPPSGTRSRLELEVLTVLDQAAELAVAGWPTPQEDNANNAYGHKGTVFSDLPTTAQTAGWPTPMAGNPGTDTYNPAGNTDSSRKTVALLTGWKHAPTH
jgi:site-specific DNA-cytosine methylase